MRLDPRLPWDVLFLRCMQSWRDTAVHASRDHVFELQCETCPDDAYLALIEGADSWPHWMRHGLYERVTELRVLLVGEYLLTPFAGSTLDGLIWGSRSIRRIKIDPVRAEAIRLVDDYVALIDLWLRHRMTNLGDWPNRVRTAAHA